MSVINTITHYEYACNGISTLFTIPFQYHEKENLTIVLVDTTDDNSETILVAGIDFNWDGDILHPTGIITVATYSSDFELHIRRSTPLTQEHDYIDNGEFLAEDHEKAIDKPVMMIQELTEKHDDLQDEFDQYVVATDATLLDHENRITENEQDIAALQAASEGVPAGGDQYALLEKLSSVDADAGWTLPIVYQGYTKRWSELINLQGLKAALDYIMDMGYAPPNVSLTSSVSTALRERGDTITSMTLTAAITKVLNDIAEVRFYDQSLSALLDTQTSGGAIPSGGSSTYAWSGSFANNKVFRVEVDDDSVEAKPSRTATLSYSFVYPYYTGVGAAGLGTGVAALTKQIINNTSSKNQSFTANGSQKMYFAYPASYGNLVHIYDINNFDTIGDWTKTTANITGLDGNPVSYNIYEFNNFAVAGTYSYTFTK